MHLQIRMQLGIDEHQVREGDGHAKQMLEQWQRQVRLEMVIAKEKEKRKKHTTVANIMSVTEPMF